MIYLSYQNRRFKPQIEYTFRVIFPIYGVAWRLVENEKLGALQPVTGDVLISYGKTKPSLQHFPNHIHIYESGLFGESYLRLESLPVPHLERWNNLPLIYQGNGYTREQVIDSVTPDSRSIESNIDLIASTFFMLSRYEEVLLDKRDEHGRFPARESLAFREGFLDRPVVNEYIELLWSWVASLNPGLRRKPLWENRPFAVCLTHDIDRVRKYNSPPWLATAGLLRQGKIRPALELLRNYVQVALRLKKDPFDTFDYLLDLEQEHSFKSSYYFMAGRERAYDPRYSLDEASVLDLVRRIENHGHEIGLHAGYGSYDSAEKIAREKERLDQAVKDKKYGCRQHGLRWRSPDTWRSQEKAGLYYDTSLAYADHVGFRAGICHPFRPFDLIGNRELDIWELPLTVMEGSLQSPAYQNLPPDRAYAEIIRLIETAKRFNGVFVLLWHNSSFDPLLGWKGWKEIYEETLEYIKGQNAFVSSGREIIEWWARYADMLPG